MKQIKKGSTDRSIILRAIDSVNGTPETGIAYNTPGIDLWYRREGGAVVSITEVTLAAVDSAHSDGGVIHVGNGYFRLDSPDVAFATGSNSIMFGGTATGMIIIGQEIQLVNYDPEDGDDLGLANLNEVTAARMGALTDWINGGRLDLILDIIAADTTTDIPALIDALPTAAENADAAWDEILSGHLDAGSTGYVLNAAGAAGDPWSTAIPGSYGAGTAGLLLGTTIPSAIGAIGSIVDAILVDTGTTLQAELDGIQADTEDLQTQIGVDGAGLTAVPWNAAWDAEVQSECADALNAYDPPTKAELDVVDGHVSDTFDDVGDVKAVVDNIIADTNELQTDWHDGGRLDLLLDAAAAGDATEANQTIIINHLTSIKDNNGGADFDASTDSLNAIRDRGDVAWITGEGLTGSNAVTLTIQDESSNNIVGAFVDIFDSGNTTFYGRLITNSSGQVSFSADNGTYIIRILKAGYVFDNETLVVDGVEVETYSGTAYAPSAPSEPNICRVYEYAFMPDGTPMPDIKAYAKINTLPFNANSVLYAGQNITAEYNSITGRLYWDLVQASSVKFTIKELGVDVIETIPASATVRLSDI